MAKYIKQELPDLQQTGEQKVYYRLKTSRNIDTHEFVRSLSCSFNGMKEGDIIRVLMATADHLGKLLGEGYSVTLDGIGNYKATIGLEENKELDTLDGNETKRNARSLQLKGVNYRAVKWAHDHGIYAQLHSCGDVHTLLPDILATGVDALNPLEVKAGMDALKIKREYGDRLVLRGGINAVLWNDTEKILAEIDEKVPILKENGGFIFSSDHSIPNSVSLENMKRIVEEVKRVGKY